ncbi:hypothetical protein HK096_008638 [Nowakowskiella sp. JEL0078]|nr:hypothetical protein HK096_008638 [Nowakowskiella sp. JEL0078]
MSEKSICIVVQPHISQVSEQLDLEIGDKISLETEFGRWGRGINERTQKRGLFPNTPEKSPTDIFIKSIITPVTEINLVPQQPLVTLPRPPSLHFIVDREPRPPKHYGNGKIKIFESRTARMFGETLRKPQMYSSFEKADVQDIFDENIETQNGSESQMGDNWQFVAGQWLRK